MTIPHEFWLVVLSVAIAIQGSFVGLSLSLELDIATGFRRRLVLAGSALTLATGIWSMHFVGMLAASFPSAVDYLALPTLVSFLICVIVVGLGVYAAHAPGPPRMRIGCGALAMGLGICAMHMLACRQCIWPARRSSSPLSSPPRSWFGGGKRACALGAGEPAQPFPPVSRRRRTGLAISGMHYTAMAGMRLDPLCFDVAHFVSADSALSRNTLALLATLISFGVSGRVLAFSRARSRSGGG